MSNLSLFKWWLWCRRITLVIYVHFPMEFKCFLWFSLTSEYIQGRIITKVGRKFTRENTTMTRNVGISNIHLYCFRQYLRLVSSMVSCVCVMSWVFNFVYILWLSLACNKLYVWITVCLLLLKPSNFLLIICIITLNLVMTVKYEMKRKYM